MKYLSKILIISFFCLPIFLSGCQKPIEKQPVEKRPAEIPADLPSLADAQNYNYAPPKFSFSVKQDIKTACESEKDLLITAGWKRMTTGEMMAVAAPDANFVNEVFDYFTNSTGKLNLNCKLLDNGFVVISLTVSSL